MESCTAAVPDGDQHHRVVVIGVTGAGKSTLCNLLSGKNPHGKDPEGFSVSAMPNACTFKTMTMDTTWLGIGPKVTIIDTPGLDDPEGRDTEHIADMVSHLKKTKFIHAFVIVFNGQNPRLDKSLISMMRIFSGMFGTGFWKNTIMAFSRWAFDRRTQRNRENNGITEDDHKRRWNQKFREVLECKKDLPIVFVDAHYDKDDDNEAEAFQRETNTLWGAISGMEAYECKDFDAIKSELDKIMYEKKVADAEKHKAEEDAKKAEEEKKQAEEQKEKAEVEAFHANVEKVQAKEDKTKAEENAKKAAEAKRLAEEQKKMAEFKASHAIKEKTRADEDKTKAEEKAKKADKERKHAEERMNMAQGNAMQARAEKAQADYKAEAAEQAKKKAEAEKLRAEAERRKQHDYMMAQSAKQRKEAGAAKDKEIKDIMDRNEREQRKKDAAWEKRFETLKNPEDAAKEKKWKDRIRGERRKASIYLFLFGLFSLLFQYIWFQYIWIK